MKRLKKTYSLTVKRGIYQAVIYFPQPDGKRKAKWISLGIREDEKGALKRAKEKFEQIRQEYDGVESADPLTTPFSDYLLKWIEGLRGHRSNTTVD